MRFRYPGRLKFLRVGLKRYSGERIELAQGIGLSEEMMAKRRRRLATTLLRTKSRANENKNCFRNYGGPAAGASPCFGSYSSTTCQLNAINGL